MANMAMSYIDFGISTFDYNKSPFIFLNPDLNPDL